MEPARRTTGPNQARDQVKDQDRDAEKGRNKAGPVVKKGQKAAAGRGGFMTAILPKNPLCPPFPEGGEEILFISGDE